MSYKVQLTEQARQDLCDICEYIAFFLLEPETAQNIKNKILNGLKSLNKMQKGSIL